MPRKDTSTWAPEHHAELERLIADGLSFAKAADALTEKFGQPFTRNACCGRAHRKGMKSDPVIAVDARSAGAARNRNRKKGDLKRAVRTAFPAPPDAPKLTVEQISLRCVEIVPRHLSLLDLEPNDCRYPYGDHDFTFCGHPKADGSPYCRPHLALCVGRGTESERAATRGIAA